MKLILPTLLAAIFTVPFQTVHAQITVNKSVLEFSAEQKIQDVEIFNSGEFKIYLDLKLAEIMKPEAAEPERFELADPRTAAILVTPQQILVPPGQRKRVRVILREPAKDQDRIYRLAIKPYTGDLNIDSDDSATKTSAIKVLLGYDLLLLSRPESLQPELDVNRDEKSITFVNTGNTNILLRRIVQCDKAKTECNELQPNRLYAGETLKLELPVAGDVAAYPVEVWQAVGLQSSREIY